MPPLQKPKYTTEQVIAALERSRGMITVAARQLGCSPRTVHNYVKRNRLIREAITDQREMAVDIAELALANAVQVGHAWAITFTLATIGKQRGYSRQDEIKHSGQIDVPIREIVIERAPPAKPDTSREANEGGAALDRG